MLRQFRKMNNELYPVNHVCSPQAALDCTMDIDLRLVAMAIMKDPLQSINVRGTAPCVLIDRVAGEKVQKKERKREGAGTGTDSAIRRVAASERGRE